MGQEMPVREQQYQGQSCVNRDAQVTVTVIRRVRPPRPPSVRATRSQNENGCVE